MWGDGDPGGDGSLLAAGLDLANESDVPCRITALFPAVKGNCTGPPLRSSAPCPEGDAHRWGGWWLF